MSTASLTLSVQSDGNWALTPVDVPNDFPPIALPAHQFHDHLLAMGYARSLLEANGAISPDAPALYWGYVGHTFVKGKVCPAYRATWEAVTETA